MSTTRELSLGAEISIPQMWLEEGEDKIIKTCLSKYTRPDKWLSIDTLKWAVRCIINAASRIIGKSDWQQARNLIQERLLGRVYLLTKHKTAPNLEESRLKNFGKEARQETKKVAGELLGLCFLQTAEAAILLVNIDLEQRIEDIWERNVLSY